MRESKYKAEKGLVFRETFNSEQDVRRNGGVLTDVTFENGTGIFNGTSSKIIYDKKINGTVTIRIKFNHNGGGLNKVIADFRNAALTGEGYVQITTLGAILTPTSSTNYVNGVLSNTISNNKDVEMIVAGLSVNSLQLYIGSNITPASFIDGNIDLFEIYEGTWSAEEVANAYNNARYADPNLNHAEQLSSEMVDQNTWYTAAYWDLTFYPNWSQVGNTLVSDGTNGFVTNGSWWEIGKRYLVTITITRTAGTCYLTDVTAVYNPMTASGTYSFYVTPVTTTLGIRSLGFAGAVIALSIKEVLINETKEILNVNALNGTVVNKYVGDVINGNLVPEPVATDIEVVRDGSIYTPKFNGSTSKIDCGSYYDYDGEFTILAWIDPKSFGEGNAGHILSADTSKVNLYISTSNNTIGFTRDGAGHTAVAANSAIDLKGYVLVAITSDAGGTSNIYVNSILSGSADQDAGASVVDTDTYIGNRSSDDRAFDGKIPQVRIIDGILTPAEISQIYTSEKHKYGL